MKPFRKKGSNESAPGRRQALKADDRPDANDLSNRYAFRRNRTLTGSSSAQIASSNELNAEIRSPRAHVHHLTNLRRKLLLSFAAVGVVSFGLYMLVSQLVATTAVQVSGVTLLPAVDKAAYHKALDSYYAARPAERLRFLLNEPELLSHLQAIRPEIRSVRIDPAGKIGEASVSITARQPIARWSLGSGNQYVDGEGTVFARNYFADPSLEIIDNSGVETSSTRLVASNRFLGFVGLVIARSASSGLAVTKVTIPAFTTRQVTVNLAGKTTDYKLSVDRSAGQQVEDIVRIDRYLASGGITPGYVDVRIAGKAFYK